jgi:hypothetical protein
MKDEWHTPADGDTQALYYEILDPEPQSKWSISALIRFYPDDGSVNPRISVTVDYTDGTSTTAQNSSIIKDGVERLLSATVSATAGKIVKRVRGWVLDHSGGTANKHSDVRHIQLEPGDVTDWRPSYKSGILVEGPTTNLFTNPGWNDGTLTGWSNYVAGIGAGTRTVSANVFHSIIILLWAFVPQPDGCQRVFLSVVKNIVCFCRIVYNRLAENI